MTEQVLEFVVSVCTRPAMYVGRHRFGEAVAFLEGCAWGLSRSGADREEMAPLADLLDRFQYWLTERFGSSYAIPWAVLIEHAYPDDTTRLQELARLLRQCAAEAGRAPNEDGL
jgi:hypothetical protein